MQLLLIAYSQTRLPSGVFQAAINTDFTLCKLDL